MGEGAPPSARHQCASNRAGAALAMEWWIAFTLIVGALCVLMVIGMPIAFAFLAVNIAGAYIFWGGVAGINQMVLAVMGSGANFSIIAGPLFLLIGGVLVRSRIVGRLIGGLAAWRGGVLVGCSSY